jgi:hypothetical protein
MGPPCVFVRPTPTVTITPWMESIVAASLPHDECPKKINATLEQCNGDVNAAVAILLEEWETRSNQDETESISPEEAFSQPEVLEARVEPLSPADSMKELQPGIEQPVFESQIIEMQSQPVVEVMLSPQPTEVQQRAQPVLTAFQQPLGAGQSSVQGALEYDQEQYNIQDTTEAGQNDISRIKRRKSPDGSPISASSSGSDDSSSVGSSGSSSGSSDSDPTERRRRKSASKPTLPLQPTRRSPRIKARAASIAAARAAAPPLTPPKEQPPRRRQATKKKQTAPGCRKQKDGSLRFVTVGIKELYV